MRKGTLLKPTAPREPVVYLVGAGPGDPDLLTMKAHRCITTADIVIYDRLVSEEILRLVPAHIEKIYVGKRKHLHAMSQHDINQLMIRKACSVTNIVRLKGGDPFIFGRGGEEVRALKQAGVRCEVVPGITAASGAAASVHLPLTLRQAATAVTFVTAHRQDGALKLDWDLVLRPSQTVVFYMGLSLLADLVAELLARGASNEKGFSVISNATRSDEICIHATLGSILAEPLLDTLPSPALLVLHETPVDILAVQPALKEELMLVGAR